MQGHGREDLTVDEAEALQTPQRRGEHLRRDALQLLLQGTEALRPLLQSADGQRRPLVCHHIEQIPAGALRRVHIPSRLTVRAHRRRATDRHLHSSHHTNPVSVTNG